MAGVAADHEKVMALDAELRDLHVEVVAAEERWLEAAEVAEI